MLLDDRGVNGAQFGAGRLEVDSRSEPSKKIGHPVDAALHHRRIEMMRARDHVSDDLGLGRVRHRRFQHADNGGRAVAEPDPLPDDRFVALQCARPEAVREHRCARCRRPIVGGGEQAPSDRPQTHHIEIRPADHAGANDPRFPEADERELNRREVAEGGERLDARL